jgi:AhpD family alkylhydroperoxidase
VVAAYDTLRDACMEAGPLDESAVALVKLAVSVGAGAERTVHMHSKKALRAGVDPDALRHVALLALPTIGLPAALDALCWVDESIQEVRCAERRG